MTKTKIVCPHEPVLFTIALVISVILWVAIIVGTFGVALMFLGFMAIFYLFIQSGFVSHLKGRGALVAVDQFPDLRTRVEECATK